MARSVSTKPSSPERMSRRQPKTSKPGRRMGLPKELFSNEQFSEIGAIILMWNQIETFIDWLTHIALQTPFQLIWEIARLFPNTAAKCPSENMLHPLNRL